MTTCICKSSFFSTSSISDDSPQQLCHWLYAQSYVYCPLTQTPPRKMRAHPLLHFRGSFFSTFADEEEGRMCCGPWNLKVSCRNTDTGFAQQQLSQTRRVKSQSESSDKYLDLPCRETKNCHTRIPVILSMAFQRSVFGRILKWSRHGINLTVRRWVYNGGTLLQSIRVLQHIRRTWKLSILMANDFGRPPTVFAIVFC